MAQRAIDSIRANSASQSTPQPVPRLGMRGGLGKTLLIAFLLLTIVPLSLLAVLTYSQIRHDTRHKLVTSLETMAALKEAHLLDWVRGYEHQLSLFAGALEQDADLASQLAVFLDDDPALMALSLVDASTGDVLASTDPAQTVRRGLGPVAMGDGGLAVAPSPLASGQPILAIRYAWGDRMLVGQLSWDSLQQLVTAYDDPEEGQYTTLIISDGWMLSGEGLALLSSETQGSASQGIVETLQGQGGSGAYASLEGAPVFGAYRWNPELQAGILIEQSQLEALATGNTLTALVVGATLAVALITSALAAVVTRRVTRPIVQLTETAARMARGDLEQQVTITRKDEIGILARAFNRMAAELTVLYGDLEAKVAERTRQLEEANRQTNYYLVQLATSAEVARVATSIRDLEPLLSTVVGLIGRAFELHYAAIYLLDDSGQWSMVALSPCQTGDGESRAWSEEGVEVGDSSLVGRVAADRMPRVVRDGDIAAQDLEDGLVETFQVPVACEMAVPLRVRERTLGVLDLQSIRPNDFGENELEVYQSLADQISIAIENARAYAVERETVERLRELDRIQSQFLTNMSHALRTPLNSVIGFSRVLIKELDGPLNEMQHADLLAIYDSGRQLLGLINDMLDLSQLQLGVAPFSPGEVDLAEIVEGVMATARALARGKAVQLYEEVPENLPIVYTDGQRVRQVILALLSNAVKFTGKGNIHLSAVSKDGQVTVSVKDTGAGIPVEELGRIFSDARHDEPEADGNVPGFGLAISKQVVERLGGQIWVDSVEGIGSTFTFTLPIRPIGTEQL
jgi:signal transduction histidine kinase